MKKLKIFALGDSLDFGKEVANSLGINLCNHEEYNFDDGESYCSSLENVRGCDVFVIHSLYGDSKESVHDKLLRTLIFLGSLRDASAKRTTIVSPYLCFGRQDRKTSSRAPITTKYIARLFKSVWADRILSLDVHSPTAIQNAYPIPVDLLEANNLFAMWTRSILLNRGTLPDDLLVLAPDSGGLGRADKFRKILGEVLRLDGNKIGIACMYKIHQGREIKGHGIMGDVKGKTIIIYDDMISSGKTVLECVEAVQKREAKEVLSVCASHGLFVGKANDYLDSSFLKNIAITDTIRPFRLDNESVKKKINVIKTANLFAEAIRRIHGDESISDLINNHHPHDSRSLYESSSHWMHS